METLVKNVAKEAETPYRSSHFYSHTIWPHALGTSKYARIFAVETGANPVIAEIGGLLHDIGAAKYGKKDHHLTGMQEASVLLIRCGCPLELVGSVLSTIYTHRGSQRIAFQVPEGVCVAAADAMDHFENVDELVLVHRRDLRTLELQIFLEVSQKLDRDWQKTDPQIRAMLDSTFTKAKRRLVQIISGKARPRERQAISLGD